MEKATTTVEVGGSEYEVTVTEDGAAEVEQVYDEPEAVLLSNAGAEMLIADMSAVEIESIESKNDFRAFFDDEARHPESSRDGNSNGHNSYDRNWYFTEMRAPK